MPDERGPCQKVRDLVERTEPAFRPYWDAMDEEEAFLDGDRYEDDHGAYNRDRRLIQVRGQETQDTCRHVAAQATARPRSVDTKPIDRDDDPGAGEIAASLVEHELSNPWKGFEDYYEDAIQACRERRAGIVWMDWDRDEGPFGEILFSYEDTRRYMWDPGYDPHHPKCAWLLRKRRLDTEVARETFKAEWLQPDREFGGHRGSQLGRPLRQMGGPWGWDASIDDHKTTIWECWYKKDKTVYQRQKRGDRLPDGKRYMVCSGGCGYRGEPMPGLPEIAEQACPTCGGNLERIDVLDQDESVLAYAKGRRLVMMAPFSPAPDDKPLYDNKWPIPTARTFPMLFLTAYPSVGRLMGTSDTKLMWDQQVAADNLRTTALQRVLEHRSYFVLPRTGIVDGRGQRYGFRDDQFNVMYRDASKSQMGALNVEVINSSGLDPAFGQVFDVTQAALTQYRGVTDLGLTPSSSKNIAASTVAQLTEQGEIPTEHFNRRKNRALGKFYGVVWDYIRATYTPARRARLNIEGVDLLESLAGDDLPNYDFIIADSRPFTGVEKTRLEAARDLLQVAQTQPDWIELYAELNDYPRSIVAKIAKKAQEVQAKQEMAMALGIAPPGMPGGEMLPEEGGEPMSEEMEIPEVGA